MRVWQAARAAGAALTRTVTCEILAPYETQRPAARRDLPLASPGKSKCVPIDPGGEMVTPIFFFYFRPLFSDHVAEKWAKVLLNSLAMVLECMKMARPYFSR